VVVEGDLNSKEKCRKCEEQKHFVPQHHGAPTVFKHSVVGTPISRNKRCDTTMVKGLICARMDLASSLSVRPRCLRDAKRERLSKHPWGTGRPSGRWRVWRRRPKVLSWRRAKEPSRLSHPA
ncbi:unnamed protein product, partial [Citrullus colocynthis]